MMPKEMVQRMESRTETNRVFLTDSGRWSIKLLLMLTLSVCVYVNEFLVRDILAIKAN